METDYSIPNFSNGIYTGNGYTVKSGDTLSKIAAQFKTTVAAIATLNNIANVNLIRVGQVLRIPSSASNTPVIKTPVITGATNTSGGINTNVKNVVTQPQAEKWYESLAKTLGLSVSVLAIVGVATAIIITKSNEKK